MAALTYNLNEQGKSDPIPQVLPQVLQWPHCWLLLQLGVHPGHIGLQLLLKQKMKCLHCRGSGRDLTFLSDLHRSSALENEEQRSHAKAWLTSLPAVGQGGRREQDRAPELSTADQRDFHFVCI